MNPKKQRRLAFVIALLLAGAGAAALVVFALRDNVLFFYSPTELAEAGIPPGQSIRIGGLVESGSVVRQEGLGVSFVVTDCRNSIEVSYSGVLPDLFREGQGIIAIGAPSGGGGFEAREVLARHDENYVPPEVAAAIEHAAECEETGMASGTL
ncbi:MAG: cytochrome c maturation protein CcmE [Alphaproteobacteria bacterium]|jgi:cytochrome c-type biogenesis protein CcmE